MPAVGLTRSRDPVGHERSTHLSNGPRPEHRLRGLPGNPPRQGAWAPFRPLFQVLRRPMVPLALGSDTSHQPLQPFSCHENPADPQLPSTRLSPHRPPRPAHYPRPRVSPNADTRPSTTVPNSRCRHLRPWVATQLTLRRPIVATFDAAGFPTGDPVSVTTRGGFFGHPRIRRGDGKRPLSQPRDRPVSRPVTRGSQNPLGAPHVNGTHSLDPGRVPSIGPSDSSPRLRLGLRPKGRH